METTTAVRLVRDLELRLAFAVAEAERARMGDDARRTSTQARHRRHGRRRPAGST
jgi:hypothetical protein